MATKNNNLEQKVADLVESLPSMPASAERLLAAAGRHEGAEAEGKLVSGDPGLCFELLHMGNSSCFDGTERVGGDCS